jgi:putative sugar O-methyltransferase
MQNEIFRVINRDLSIILKEYEQKNIHAGNEGVWGNRLPIWFGKIIKNSKIDEFEIKNFIGYSTLLSEIPCRSKNMFQNMARQLIREPGYRKYCFNNYEKLLNCGYRDRFKKYILSSIGNPSYYEIDSFKFNERFLRHIRTVELFLDNIRKQHIGQLTVLDVGGGYSQFAYMLKEKSFNTTVATLDFKEQLLLSYFYIKFNNPALKVNSLDEILNQEKIDKDFIQKFDIVLIPIECFDRIDGNIFNCVCNFSSFGEMSDDSFKKYLNSNIIRNATYFFTINRLDSWPSYNNSISILNYNLNKYEKIHEMISPLWDYYYLSFTKFYIKKIPFKSRNFEFIGKNNNLF